jgi:hypothetical protein
MHGYEESEMTNGTGLVIFTVYNKEVVSEFLSALEQECKLVDDSKREKHFDVLYVEADQRYHTALTLSLAIRDDAAGGNTPSAATTPKSGNGSGGSEDIMVDIHRRSKMRFLYKVLVSRTMYFRLQALHFIAAGKPYDFNTDLPTGSFEVQPGFYVCAPSMTFYRLAFRFPGQKIERGVFTHPIRCGFCIPLGRELESVNLKPLMDHLRSLFARFSAFGMLPPIEAPGFKILDSIDTVHRQLRVIFPKFNMKKVAIVQKMMIAMTYNIYEMLPERERPSGSEATLSSVQLKCYWLDAIPVSASPIPLPAHLNGSNGAVRGGSAVAAGAGRGRSTGPVGRGGGGAGRGGVY